MVIYLYSNRGRQRWGKKKYKRVGPFFLYHGVSLLTSDVGIARFAFDKRRLKNKLIWYPRSSRYSKVLSLFVAVKSISTLNMEHSFKLEIEIQMVSLNSRLFFSCWRTTVMIGVTKYWYWRNRGLRNRLNLKFALFLKCDWLSVPNYFHFPADKGLGQTFEWVISHFLIVYFRERYARGRDFNMISCFNKYIQSLFIYLFIYFLIFFLLSACGGSTSLSKSGSIM